MCSARSSRQAELKHAGISLQQGGTTSPQLYKQIFLWRIDCLMSRGTSRPQPRKSDHSTRLHHLKF